MDKQSFLNKTLGILDNQDVNINQLILEAHRLGIHVEVYAGSKNDSFKYADKVILGSLDNKPQLKLFASQCQWVIYADTISISGTLINYLSQFTKVPQGKDTLDLINDQSILHVFLDSLRISSLPYLTVFSLSDVRQALTKMDFPVILRPVQTDLHKSQSVLITNDNELDQLGSLFNGGSYILESLPKEARYFNLNIFKSGPASDVILPVVEKHYRDSKVNFANLNPKLPLGITDKFKMLAQKIMNSLNYVGGLTISFIVTNNQQIYVNGLDLPFTLENSVFKRTPDNITRILLRMIIGAEVKLPSLKQTWLIKPVDKSNFDQFLNLWQKDGQIDFNLDALIDSGNQPGYVLMSADSFKDVINKLKVSQL